MYCPNCGKADQQEETYCRQCGIFLPDISKPAKREQSPEENLKANTVLNLMTIITSFTLAILLYAILGFRPGTHPLIYVTAGLLLAIGAWHIQTFIRTQKLKKQWKRRMLPSEDEAVSQNAQPAFQPAPTAKFDAVPASVTENTTRHLKVENHHLS